MTSTEQHRDSISRSCQRATTGALTLAMLFLSLLATIPRAQAQEHTRFILLYSFKGGRDGAAPIGGMVRDKLGNLYGTTAGNLCGNRYGTVFKLDPRGNQTVLHSFEGGADGEAPLNALIRDAAGNLYGTTYGGLGTVFEVDATGKYTVLYNFRGGADGWNPDGVLIRDSNGNLYGTTSNGGTNEYGTVFKLDSSSNKTTLYNFKGTDGVGPFAGLISDVTGNLYGTTGYGGAYGFGTVFKLDPSGNETVLYSFSGGSDGAAPITELIRDAIGNLYGTTSGGGAYGWGTIFKLDPSGNETVLYSFTGGQDGKFPYGALLWSEGNFYGTTSDGGAFGLGTVFKLDPSGNQTVLYSFKGAGDGALPYSGLIRDAAGNLYGTAAYGGVYGCGTVFRVTP